MVTGAETEQERSERRYTRATSLSWPDEVRRGFAEELRRHLRSRTEVPLTQQTSLTMARVR